MGGKGNSYNILVGNTDVKRPRSRPGRRWEDNIKTDLKEVWLEDVNWFIIFWPAYMDKVIHLRVQQKAGDHLISGRTINFSVRTGPIELTVPNFCNYINNYNFDQ
jgi:hypothetical protein